MEVPDSSRLERGARVGKFEVIGQLGEGGMGTVYEARDLDLGRDVAIKLLHDVELSGSLRLMREAQGLARVQHPNVVAVFEVGHHEDLVYLAMEKVDGASLDKHGAADWRVALRWYVQAGRGLAAVHACGLVHRDIKPSNLLLDREGRVRVGDFGLVRAAGTAFGGGSAHAPPVSPSGAATISDVTVGDEDATAGDEDEEADEADDDGNGHDGHDGDGGDDHGNDDDGDDDDEHVDAPRPTPGADVLGAPLTRSATFVGTPRYMAPEQHLRQQATAHSDQFAFCVAAWEALFGEHPFARDDGQSWSEAILAGRRNQRRPRTVPRWLVAALDRGLARDPASRHGSMDELVELLERTPARRRLAWSAGAVVAVLGGAAIAIGVASGRTAEPSVDCEAAGSGFDAVWSAGARERIAKTFAAARPHGADTAQRVAARLDAYRARWSATRVDSCRATHERGEQSPALLDRRMRCADAALAEARILIEGFGEANGKLVDGALDAIARLPDPAGCGPQLASTLPDPDDPRVADIRRDRAQARRAYERGDLERARELIGGARKAADALGHPRIRAETTLAAVRILEDDQPAEVTSRALEQALADATRAADRELEAEATAWMLRRAALANDQASLRSLLPVATIAATRDGLGANVRRFAAMAEGDAQRVLGRFDEGLAACDRLARLEDAARVEATDCRCKTLAQAVRSNEAAAACAEAVTANERSFGPAHPYTAGALGTLAAVETQRGRHEEALRLRKRTLAIIEPLYGPTSAYTLHYLQELATSYAALRRYDEARVPSERAVEGFRRSGPGRPLALALMQLGEVEIGSGRTDEGFRVMAEAIAMHERAVGAAHAMHVEVIAYHAEMLYNAERWQPAEEAYRRCAELAPKAFGEDSVLNGGCIGARAATLVELGRAREALPLAERAIALLAKRDGDSPLHLATARMARGRALAELGDRSAARGELEAALAQFKAAGDADNKDLKATERRLAALR